MSIVLAKKMEDSTTATKKKSLLNRYLLELEEVCAQLMDTHFSSRGDTDRIIWQQRFKNILTSISLSLAEVRGVRKFHYHYRHDKTDSSVLLPVLEDPIDLLAHSCELALEESAKKLSSVHDRDLMSACRSMEHALRNFLLGYRREKMA